MKPSIFRRVEQDVEHLTLVVDALPEIHPLTADIADHLVEGRRPPALQLSGDLRPELGAPAADRLVGDVDTALWRAPLRG
ncbi:hypothetical protein ACFOMD_10050 [Sphingoaurantiacus capsulatus]|uniref:Uncharacterized protein n=1 Tax=Sphingoaurantiacus capsulatus TaxID=1771310 RepID=A0ABV7XCE3_9SPHN